ncbi:MAG: hypothetical protein GEV00_09165 [Actinophytocola sp.]|nr:hypothetical protein [Actinophytocola sp.]
MPDKALARAAVRSSTRQAEDDRRLHRELAATPNNGGQFFFDEVTAKALASQLFRLLFDPPRTGPVHEQTEIATVYAAFVIDVYSRRIIGWRA